MCGQVLFTKMFPKSKNKRYSLQSFKSEISRQQENKFISIFISITKMSRKSEASMTNMCYVMEILQEKLNNLNYIISISYLNSTLIQSKVWFLNEQVLLLCEDMLYVYDHPVISYGGDNSRRYENSLKSYAPFKGLVQWFSTFFVSKTLLKQIRSQTPIW